MARRRPASWWPTRRTGAPSKAQHEALAGALGKVGIVQNVRGERAHKHRVLRFAISHHPLSNRAIRPQKRSKNATSHKQVHSVRYEGTTLARAYFEACISNARETQVDVYCPPVFKSTM